ncbi:hypothetical protein Rhal01_03707 [Rubritalea halochordaticola]|uniref:Uncharacterized protein n=1 Tax=Rubritalea halochordaticola TaxID=714537 RepID=A0ABP9V8X4_9BACT
MAPAGSGEDRGERKKTSMMKLFSTTNDTNCTNTELLEPGTMKHGPCGEWGG